MKAKLRFVPLLLTLFLTVGCSTSGPKGDKGDTGNGIASIEKTNTSGNVDTYTITYTNGEKTIFTVTNGADGAQGIQGVPGQDGHTPVITIGSNGNWYVDGVDTGIHAQGEKGDKGDTGNGIASIEKTNTSGNVDTYTITYTNGEKTIFTVTNGADGAQGIQGVPGQDGHTPVITIGSNGNWYVDGVDTGIHAQGEKGDKGDTGLSAYEIYLKYYPEYTGTEKDWIDDLTLGVLGEKYTITWVNYDGTILEIDENVSRRAMVEYNGDTPQKSGNSDYCYAFSGWSPSIEPAICNVTYTAIFTELKIELDSINSYAYITGYNEIGSNIVIPSSILVDGTSYSVTSIGDRAFYNCSSLTSIVIPDSVTSIGDHAFSYCSSLIIYCEVSSQPSGWDSEWNYSGRTVYWGVTQENIIIQNGIQYLIIDGNAVVTGHTDELPNQVVIPSSITANGTSYSVTSIGDLAFYGCSSLTSVTFESGSKLTSIEVSAFYDCSSLTSIVLPDSVTSIGDFAFWNCNSLTIYCEASSQPSGWGSNGNASRPVYWGVTQEDIIIQNGIQYLIIDGNAVVTGRTNELLNQVMIPSSITVNGTNYSVTSIGYYAFYRCSSLTSIVIPDSVTSIGSYAFHSCSSLTSIVIPDSVTSIGGYAFFYCSSLTIYCEASSQPSGWGSNWNPSNRPVCWGVTQEDIVIQNGIQYLIIDGNAVVTGHTDELPNQVVIPSSIMVNGVTYNVTSIETSAFYSCSSLTSIVIPDSVTSIGEYAFYKCSFLTSIVIPDSVTSIEDFAFSSCSRLTSIVIPDSVTSIGYHAFSSCSRLTSIVIPDSVTSIGDDAFHYCSSLQYNEYGNCLYLGNEDNPYLVLVKAKNTSITEATISNNTRFIMGDAFSGCSSLTSIVIPDSVTSIGYYAFSGCSSLTSIVIPDSVTSIGDGAFHYCSSLQYNEYGNCLYLGNEDNPYLVLVKAKNTSITEATISNNTRFIMGDAFSDCSSLTSIVIPDSVTSIGYHAFYYCNSLTIYCEASSKPSRWDSTWNSVVRSVYWAGEWSYVDGVPTPNN